MTSLYDQIGQEPAVIETVKRFYERVLADPELAPLFVGVDLDRLNDHQVAFFTQVLGGPEKYSGRALQAAHRGLGITDAQFNLVGGHLAAVLAELGVDEASIATVAGVVESVRPDIVEAS